jgi:hypothetical protein
MNAEILPSRFCWQRFRLVLFWGIWLVVILGTVHEHSGFACSILIAISFFIRPRWNADPESGNRPLTVLSVVWFLIQAAVVISWITLNESPRHAAFFRSPIGSVLIIAVWLVFAIPQIRIYRRLPPFRSSAGAS